MRGGLRGPTEGAGVGVERRRGGDKVVSTGKRDILEMAPDAIEGAVEAMGEAAFRGRQVLSWVFGRFVRDFGEMSDLPGRLRSELAERFCVGKGRLAGISRATRGRTAKLLFELADGTRVEAVSMREGGRHTACLSSQAGCAMGCGFCATGAMGFERNLSCGEMLLQFLEISRSEGEVNRVVFMGMGEPLLNVENVLQAVGGLMDERRFGLGGRRITISTCGIVPGIRELAARKVPARLALSLNSPFQERRERLMPISKKYPLRDVLAACEDYVGMTGRRVTLEYVLLKGENTSRDAARATARIARRLGAKVNLIEYNPVKGSAYASPTRRETMGFREVLERAGVRVTIRFRRGREIAAGCGQLAAHRGDG